MKRDIYCLRGDLPFTPGDGTAKDKGAVTEDVTVDEFFVLVRGLAQAAATMPAAPMTLDRAIEIICRGLAPAR